MGDRSIDRVPAVEDRRRCDGRAPRWCPNCWKTEKEIHHVVGHSGKSGPRIRWHYTTTILRLRIGARLTAHFYPCTLALSAGTPGWTTSRKTVRPCGWLSPKLRLQLKIDVAAGENPHDAWTAYSSCTAAETVEWVQVKGKERSALKIKHHHCHEIACSWNLVNLITGQRVLTRDPRDPLRFVDPLDPWPADPLSSLGRRRSDSCRKAELEIGERDRDHSSSWETGRDHLSRR